MMGIMITLPQNNIDDHSEPVKKKRGKKPTAFSSNPNKPLTGWPFPGQQKLKAYRNKADAHFNMWMPRGILDEIDRACGGPNKGITWHRSGRSGWILRVICEALGVPFPSHRSNRPKQFTYADLSHVDETKVERSLLLMLTMFRGGLSLADIARWLFLHRIIKPVGCTRWTGPYVESLLRTLAIQSAYEESPIRQMALDSSGEGEDLSEDLLAYEEEEEDRCEAEGELFLRGFKSKMEWID